MKVADTLDMGLIMLAIKVNKQEKATKSKGPSEFNTMQYILY